MTIDAVRREAREKLAEKYGEREAAAMARMIIMHLKNWSLEQMLADEGREASDFIINRSREIVGQLLDDMPIQYALGETAFYGLKLNVKPGVLIPRPETEELVDLIVRENRQDDLRVLDLCTGSGAIAIALARNLPFARVTGIDVSHEAIEIAQENAKKLKSKIELIEDDIFQPLPLRGKFDIIVSNPPYICENEKAEMENNVLDYEPHIALFVPDDDPLKFYRRIAEIGEEYLRTQGRLYLEINPLYAMDLREMLERTGYHDVEIVKDIHGKDRFIQAVKE